MPDDIQAVKNMKVRIRSLPTNAPFAASALSIGLFQIVGSLTMSVPNDVTPVAWRINSTANEIKWNAVGSIVNVKLEYSTNSGTDWTTITGSATSGAGNNKTYSWNIPGTVAIMKDNVRYRVSDSLNSDVVDTSDAASSFLASFTITAPVTGNVWVAGSANDITWSTPQPGVPATVKIEYNVGSGWNPIPENYQTGNDGIVANSGTQSWTLGTTLTTAAQIRISDPANASSLVASDLFKIRGSLTMTAPNAGTESWLVGSTQAITWTKQGDITAVKLQYSTNGDDGPSYVALIDGDAVNTQNIDVTGAGPYTFNWKIPSNGDVATATTARIRVVDANDATVYDPANSNFTVKGSVTLVGPDGGNTLQVDDVYAINGTVLGPIANVKMYYSTNGGTTYPNAVTGCETVAVNTGAFSCNWTIPNVIDTDIRVRVEDAANSAVFDASSSDFAIKGTATITAPTAGAVWIAGASHNILWDRTGTIGNVDLSYNVNNGAYSSIATSIPSPNASGNSYAWTVPSDNIVSANVKVKIAGTNMVADVISGAFTVKGSLTLTYPDASGINLTLGDTINVTWNAAGNIGDVKVEYFNGTGWSTLTTTAAQAGPYVLLLDAPNTTVATDAALVRITDADEAAVTDTSANAFTVKPYLAVTSPAGNEAWTVGTAHDITWNHKGTNVTDVDIYYSKNSGTDYLDQISATTTNDGTYSWTMPDDIQAVKNMKVRVRSLPTNAPYAASAISGGLFQVVGSLTMAVPNDVTPVAWRINSTGNEIKWNAVGSIPFVKLEYSTNAGSNWSTLVASTASGAGNNKTYSWNIPGAFAIVKNDLRFRVSDAANSDILDTSDAASSTLANFAFVAPVTGNIWVAESNHDIEWTTPQAGTPATVKVSTTWAAAGPRCLRVLERLMTVLW
jgi:hypothetical protein